MTYTDPEPNSLLTICRPVPTLLPTRVMPEAVVPLAAAAPWQHSKPFVHTLLVSAVKIARPARVCVHACARVVCEC